MGGSTPVTFRLFVFFFVSLFVVSLLCLGLYYFTQVSHPVLSTGTFIAVSRYGSATPIPPSILRRGVGWQGIGILISGLLGTLTGSSASVENAGLLALTRVGSRRVVQISACFMLFFSILGKFGALFASISMPIIAAFYCVLFAYVASAGIGFLQFCNLNSFRTKFILGFSIFMGFSCLFLGLHTLPQGQCSAQRWWFGLVG